MWTSNSMPHGRQSPISDWRAKPLECQRRPCPVVTLSGMGCPQVRRGRMPPLGFALFLGLSIAACGASHSTASTTSRTTTGSSVAPGSASSTLLTRSGRIEGGLVQHTWGTQSILVPVGWVEHDTIPGGSSDIVTFNDPTSPSDLVVTINACSLCGSTTSGQPQPSNYLPRSGVIGSQRLDSYRLAYEQRTTTPNDVTDGLIVELHNGTAPDGTVTAAVTLPTTDHSMATTILNSVQTS